MSILCQLSVIQGDEKALDNCWRDYRSHTKKNVTWLLPQLVTQGANSLDDFRPLFRKDADHPFLLDQVKQISLYTDCLGRAHWSVPQDVIDNDLTKMLVQIARIFLQQRDVTPKEIELWVKHMEPQMRLGVVVDYDGSKQALLDWYADMQHHGLTPYSPQEAEAFIYGSSGEGWLPKPSG